MSTNARLIGMSTQKTTLFTVVSRRHLTAWLVVLLALFAFRVSSQLFVANYPLPYFPEFAAWHSGALPYPILLAAQIFILAVAPVFVWRFFTTSVEKIPSLGKILYAVGSLYWGLMLLRLLLGLSLLSEVYWFTQQLPALFHLLLANMFMLIGDYHRNGGKGYAYE